MTTILFLALIFFGIGAFIGATYAIVRYGIPTIIMGIIGIFQGAIEGWRQGSREFQEKYGHLKPIKTESKGIIQAVREGVQQTIDDHNKRHGSVKPVEKVGLIQTIVEAWQEGCQKANMKYGRK
ncbi:MAG: hypothetical protein K6T66_13950 [Peptococcaceae bacterium]|nr:hypothetical protein [Peptococcaceae bacterium]